MTRLRSSRLRQGCGGQARASARQARKHAQLSSDIKRLKRVLRRSRSITLTMHRSIWIALEVALEYRPRFMAMLGHPIDPDSDFERQLATALARIKKALEWPADPPSPSPPAGEVGAAPAAPGEGAER